MSGVGCLVLFVFILQLFLPFGRSEAAGVKFHLAGLAPLEARYSRAVAGADSSLLLTGLAVSDIGASDQWYLNKIQAPDAWEETQGASDITVAVIDVGMDLNHPDLINNLWVNKKEIPENGLDDDNNGYIDDVNGWDFVDNDNSPKPDIKTKYTTAAVNHGTIVAGIIAAEGNNAFAGAGVAWRAKIMPLRAFDSMGDSESYLVERAVQYATDNGADIINMSFIGLAYSPVLEEKIKAAYEKGILLVAAAGSENGSKGAVDLDIQKSYPVCHDGSSGENWILGVAAVDAEGKKTQFSNYGVNCIDIAAPGTKIYSTLYHDASSDDFNKYFGGGFNGTSVAAPQVAGAAVLVKALHPNYTNKELMRVLLESADDTDGANPAYAGRLGKGRLNVYKAVIYPAISMETEEGRRVKYALAAKAGGEPKIWYLDARGGIIKEFYAFSRSFRGGINLVLGDIDDDGMTEVIAAAGAGGSPHIRIFNLSGELKYHFFAFDVKKRNGVEVAVGDINGDGKNEIIAMEMGGSKQTIRILNGRGEILKDGIQINIKKAAALAAGDVNNDGKAEIIVAALGKIRSMDGDGKTLGEFSPFGRKFSGGINLAAGDLNNDGWADIMINKAGSPLIQQYDYTGRLLSPGFYVYDKGKSVAGISSGDVDGDKNYELVTAAAGPIKGGASNGASKGGTEIKVLDGNLNLKIDFYPFGKNSKKAVNAFIVNR